MALGARLSRRGGVYTAADVLLRRFIGRQRLRAKRAEQSGLAMFRHFSEAGIAIASAVAAGAIVAMVVDTLIPEAHEGAHDYSGLITAAGFVLAFALRKTTA
jgi:hypothetical protein